MKTLYFYMGRCCLTDILIMLPFCWLIIVASCILHFEGMLCFECFWTFLECCLTLYTTANNATHQNLSWDANSCSATLKSWKGVLWMTMMMMMMMMMMMIEVSDCLCTVPVCLCPAVAYINKSKMLMLFMFMHL